MEYMKKIIFLDTETTGNTPDDYLCQLAFKSVDETFCELFKPLKDIPPEASAITHITNKMVADKTTFRESDNYGRIKELLESDANVLVAHNAKFDIGMLANDGIEVKNNICTLRIARALDTGNVIPQYKLQFLRYYLEIEIEADAHDALGDVLVLEKLFERLFEKVKKEYSLTDEEAIEKMIEISARPSLITKIGFGKHIGKTVEEVSKTDRGYLEWLLSQKDPADPNEEDWVYTLKHYLGKLQ